jgi:hypothetical protein
LDRDLTRSEEAATEKDAKPNVVGVYNDKLKAPAEAYRAAHRKVLAAEGAYAKEHNEATKALNKLDQPYAETRATVLAYVKTAKLPATLKKQPTDTNKMNAIQDLLDIVDSHSKEAWAERILQSAFATEAAKTVQEVQEQIAADKDLQAARTERAKAYGVAYEEYIPFKRVVRTAYGPTSKQYRRLHPRSAPGSTVEEDDDTDTVDTGSEGEGNDGEPK